MRRHALVAVLLALAGIFLAQAARAEGNYLVLKGGFYTPDSNDLNDFDSGFDGEVAFGHDFARNLGAEFGVGYFQSENNLPGGDVKLEVIPVTATIKAKLPIDVIELFAGAGLGAYNADIEAGAASSSDTAFGFHAVAGASADLSQNAFLGAEFRYLWAEASFDGIDVELDGYTTTLNLGFRF